MVHKHVEMSFATLLVGNIQTLVVAMAPPNQNEVQLVIIFYLLQFRRYMIKYPLMKEL